MKHSDYRPRILDEQVERYLSVFGAVCIEGPKWSGKTWTSSYHSSSEIYIGDPAGGFQNRKLAEISPDLILDGEKPRLIDEWQEVPSIWDAVRYRVDQESKKGQFILTGSATPNHKGILHSGAGRIARLRMRTMSLFESGDSSGEVSLEALCQGKTATVANGDVSLKTLADLIIRGGWPGSLRLSPEQAALVPGEYLDAVIEDDVYRMDGIKRDTGKMKLLLRSLARNESTTASKKTLIKDIKTVDKEEIDANTVSTYLNIFERLFLIENQPPFSPGLRSSARVKQAEKRHFTDPSMACALLNATSESLMADLKTFGFMFEALCERDLRIYAESFGGKLYHYQDYEGKEIDAVIELPDGHWSAFEIKLGANQIEEASKNLLKVKGEFEKDPDGRAPDVVCVVCGMANAAYQRPDGVYVVPITALKN